MSNPAAGGGGAYGAGKAGAPFDPVTFIKKPQVILRIVSWVSGCIHGHIIIQSYRNFRHRLSDCTQSNSADCVLHQSFYR